MLIRKSFYFIRHGQTDWNVEKRAQGSTDIPLNATGRAQAEALAQAMAGTALDYIATSTLSRAADTARALGAATGAPVHADADLMEIRFGELEGSHSTPAFSEFWAGAYVPKGAETLTGFGDRILRGFNRALEQPGTVAIVSHGAVWRVLKMRIDLNSDFHAPNATPIRLDPEGETHWRATPTIPLETNAT